MTDREFIAELERMITETVRENTAKGDGTATELFILLGMLRCRLSDTAGAS